jgi:hypothetical protein
MNYFLVIFIDFFIFLNSNLNFGTGCYRWVLLPYPAVATITAVYRAVTTVKKNPASCYRPVASECARSGGHGVLQPASHYGDTGHWSPPCSLGLSATSQQYFSLRTNQPPATSHQYSSLRTNQHQLSATSQPNRLHSARLKRRGRQTAKTNRRTGRLCYRLAVNELTGKLRFMFQ